jgi:hypothetical protein
MHIHAFIHTNTEGAGMTEMQPQSASHPGMRQGHLRISLWESPCFAVSLPSSVETSIPFSIFSPEGILTWSTFAFDLSQLPNS